jgi:nicotinamide-nucleotide amidase
MKNIRAEIVTIGDEILYGQITDTNSQWISAELSQIGFKTIRKSSVGDEKEEIRQILREAESRADVILITGGLGPTKDDITKNILAEYFDSKLVINEIALHMVTEFFKSRGRELTEVNRLQAAIPDKCELVRNDMGTAPGMWFEKEGKVFVSMPGVPYEMKGMMSKYVLPKLKSFFKAPNIYHRNIRTIGIGESMLADMIAPWEDALPSHMKLAYLPGIGQVKLRITAIGDDPAKLAEETEQQVIKLQAMASKYIYGFEDDEIEKVVGELLLKQGKTISVAESCTGGFISHMLTRVSGSSRYFQGGIVPYQNKLKIEHAGVHETSIAENGAVSEPVVKDLAEGIRKKFGTDIGISCSGIAGPAGATPEKPVGTVWIAYSDSEKTITRKLQLGGSRDIIIQMTGYSILNMLRLQLLKIS